MSIMDMFKAKPAADAGNATQQQKDLSATPPTTNAKGEMPGTGITEVNPLDTYKKVMEDAAKNSDAQAPSFKLDPKVLSDVSSKMDFTSGVNPELMQKALAGDAQSLLQVIQSTSQNAYRASLEHASSLTDTFLNQRSTFENQKINSGVRDQLTQQSLSSAPNYDHPVIKQELNRVAAQFAKANPDQSPAEIAKAAQKYIQDLSAALNPQTAAATAAKDSSTEMDWSKYLN